VRISERKVKTATIPFAQVLRLLFVIWAHYAVHCITPTIHCTCCWWWWWLHYQRCSRKSSV